MLLKRLTVLTAIGVTATASAVVAADPASAATPIAGTYRTVAPIRVLDTRSGLGAPATAVPARGTITFRATSPLGSTSVSAVSLTVTALAPAADGYLTVFRGGTARPGTSNLNFQTGRSAPAAVVAQVGSGGTVSVFNGSSQPVNVIGALSGYWTGGTVDKATAGVLVPVVPTRLLDTRAATSRPLAPGSPTPVQVSGRAGVPADASGVLVNVTATATTSGYVTVSSTPQSGPAATSTVNFAPGVTRANLTSVPLGADGSISLLNGSSAPAMALVDVVGYFPRGSSGGPSADGAFLPSDPFRVADTRTGQPVPGGSSRKFPVLSAGQNSAFKAAVLNVTVLPVDTGYVSTWNGVGPHPTANLVSVTAGMTQAGLVIVPVNNDGSISIYNGTQGNLTVLVDVVGFVLNDLSAMSTSAARSRVAHVLATAHSLALH